MELTLFSRYDLGWEIDFDKWKLDLFEIVGHRVSFYELKIWGNEAFLIVRRKFDLKLLNLATS